MASAEPANLKWPRIVVMMGVDPALGCLANFARAFLKLAFVESLADRDVRFVAVRVCETPSRLPSIALEVQCRPLGMGFVLGSNAH